MNYSQEISYPHELATAHVMIKCKSDYEKKVIEYLGRINGVKTVHRTIGEYDVLAKIEAIDYETLRKIIRWKIFNSEYILSVTTLMCVRKSMCAVVE